MQFAGIFDEHQPILGKCRLGQHGIGQSGFARSGASGDKDVVPPLGGVADRPGLSCGHDSLSHIIVQGEDQFRPLADAEDGPLGNRRQLTLEALAGVGQRPTEQGAVPANGFADVIGHQTNDRFGTKSFNTADAQATLTGSVNPHLPIGVGHHFDHARIIQGLKDG